MTTIIPVLCFLGCIAKCSVSAQEPTRLHPNRVEQGPPDWLKEYKFKIDEFSFVRLKYDQPAGRWATDYPDAEINLSARLSALTSLKVSPHGLVFEVTDSRLLDHPFAYLSANGDWQLDDDQVVALRAYLDGGGFLMIDDLWGEAEWNNTAYQMARVLPGRAPVAIPLAHPIFHSVYDLQDKPQVCGIYYALRGRADGITWERPDAREATYYSLSNERGRMVALICRNTDLADGWERVDDDEWYAQEFSESKAFPMAINTIFHVLNARE